MMRLPRLLVDDDGAPAGVCAVGIGYRRRAGQRGTQSERVRPRHPATVRLATVGLDRMHAFV